ncbi:MAG: hypothetical protein M3018_04430 [Actinomycetota bacterium]|nr:hypothetical protein [Actinomycetota bacterium]
MESVSESFRARHELAEDAEATRVLVSLEITRERMAEHFPRTLVGLTVVLHGSFASLALARPPVALAWFASAPAGRRYVAGWADKRELHVLGERALGTRASALPESGEMLRLAAAVLYARRVVAENNHDLRRKLAPFRGAADLRWAWLLEGAARWFSGQTDYARPAIARRLREGRRPRFPPGVRDAALLGGTVIDLLVSLEGELAAAQAACRLHPQGPRAALSKAFCERPMTEIEGTWRAHLARLAAAG